MSIKVPSLKDWKKKFIKMQENESEINKIFGQSRTAAYFKHGNIEKPILLEKFGWVLRYFHTRHENTSDYVLYRQCDLDIANSTDRIPVIEFNCDNHTLHFNGYCRLAKNIPIEVSNLVREFIEDPQYRTTPIEIKDTSYLKMYIAVLDDVPECMVPTLVAHSILSAHLEFYDDSDYGSSKIIPYDAYKDWLNHSFRKCVVRVNRKEFEKIKDLDKVYLGHENKTLGGEKSCAVVYPVASNDVPNVLKFAKLWAPYR